MSIKIKKILVEALIFLAKTFILAKRFLTAFFVAFVITPGKTVLRFVFYKIIVKAYVYYLSLMKKLGWDRFKGSVVSFLFNHKLVHFVVIILTIVVVFTNVVNRTKAGTLSEKAHKTIAAGLVASEFGDVDESNEIIEEYFDDSIIAAASKQSYFDNSVALRSMPRASLLEEEDLSSMTNVIRGGSALVKPDMASTERIKRERTEAIEYVVQSGDTISTIAEEMDISVNTILWDNNLTAYSLIRPGDVLSILPMTGIRHSISRGETLISIAKKYDVEEEKIMEVNKIVDSSKISIGDELIIPNGRKIYPKKKTYASASTNYTSGLSAIGSIVKPANATPVASNKMNWPTVGHIITQYYSWRHKGLDIANKTGTPIYAADAGTVTISGWNSGYGYNVMVDHGGGKQTRYAHFSKLYVAKGQRVSKGETLGEMGSTGWSTGPHLHFEVIINGVKYNPLNYIK